MLLGKQEKYNVCKNVIHDTRSKITNKSKYSKYRTKCTLLAIAPLLF